MEHLWLLSSGHLLVVSSSQALTHPVLLTGDEWEAEKTLALCTPCSAIAKHSDVSALLWSQVWTTAPYCLLWRVTPSQHVVIPPATQHRYRGKHIRRPQKQTPTSDCTKQHTGLWQQSWGAEICILMCNVTSGRHAYNFVIGADNESGESNI